MQTLRITFDAERIAAQVEAYLGVGLGRAQTAAEQAIAFRQALEHKARRFHERQEARARLFPYRGEPLRDGREATLRRLVLDPIAPDAWPRRACAVLHGLDILGRFSAFGGAPEADGESYVAHLFDGPPNALEFPATLALCGYFDPLCELRILWIGDASDRLEAVADLMRETQNFSSWRSVAPDYVSSLG